jgi:hypothetical protein
VIYGMRHKKIKEICKKKKKTGLSGWEDMAI